MGSPATLVIEIIADAHRAQSGMKTAEGAVSKTSSSIKTHMKAIGGAIAGAFAADKIVDFAKESVGAASDLNETMSKTQQIFGKSGDAIIAWSKDSANAMGLSQTAALDAADNFATMGQAAGLQGPKLVTFSTHLTKLAGDMASFSNTTPDQAAEALGAALRGESEPIRQYGVLINDAAVQAQALSMGLVRAVPNQEQVMRAQLAAESAQQKYNESLKEHGKQSKETKTAMEKLTLANLSLGKAVGGQVPKLTQGQKVLATQALIMKQTKNAQGDFARTSGGLANQQRILAAKMENVKATLGKFLLPLVLKAVAGFQKLAHWVAQNKDVFIPLAAAIGAIVAAWKIWNAVLVIWTAITEANPILLIITGLVLLGAALVVAYKKSKTFRDIVKAAFDAVKTAFDVVVTAVKAMIAIWKAQFDIAKKAIKAVVDFVQKMPGRITRFLSNLWKVITAPFKKAWDWISKNVFKPLKNAFTDLPGNIKRALSNLWNIIKAPFEQAWNWIKNNVVSPIKNVFSNLAGNIGRALKGVAEAIKSPFRTAWNWIHDNVFAPIGSFFSDLPSKIVGLVSNVSSSIVNGIINLLNSALNLPWVIELHIHGPGPLPDLNFGPYTVLPKIPNLATGGFFDRPTLAMVGEAGREVVAPEPMLRRLIREELGQAGIHITVNGALDPDRVARQIEDLLEQRRRRVGGITRRGTALTGVS